MLRGGKRFGFLIMKALIFSDSHGNAYYMDKAIALHPDAEVVFFLGDGLFDLHSLMLKYKTKAFLSVRGNCDPLSESADVLGRITLDGVRITYAHGHTLGVKYSTAPLFKYASDNSAGVLLFGHTHVPHCEYKDGVYIFNPGSISGKNSTAPSYGIMDITDKGIMLSHGSFG